MATGYFPELISGRNMVVPNTTPWLNGPAMPNTQLGAKATHQGNQGYIFDTDTVGVFSIPWGVSDFTIEFWAWSNFNLPDGIYGLFHRGTTGSGGNPNGGQAARTANEWVVHREGSGGIYFTIMSSYSNTGGLNDHPFQVGVGIPHTSTWQHIVWGVETSLGTGAASKRVFQWVNNSKSTPATFTNVTPVRPANCRLWLPLVGFNQQNAYAKFAIYHRLLTDQEVNDHYLSMTSP